MASLVACAAVKTGPPAINAAVDDAVLALKRGGRLVYVGAGQSGRYCNSGWSRASTDIRLAERSRRFS